MIIVYPTSMRMGTDEPTSEGAIIDDLMRFRKRRGSRRLIGRECCKGNKSHSPSLERRRFWQWVWCSERDPMPTWSLLVAGSSDCDWQVRCPVSAVLLEPLDNAVVIEGSREGSPLVSECIGFCKSVCFIKKDQCFQMHSLR